MSWQFQYPQLIWALLLVPFLLLCYLLYIGWRKKTVKGIGEPKLVKKLFQTHSSLKSSLRFFLILIAVALGCVALMNPRTPDETFNEVRKGIDVVIALDVSNSMLATDISPNRLQQAKTIIKHLVDQLPNDRLGLVLFAGSAYVQMPLTIDHNSAHMLVAAAHPGLISGQGTAIADALEKSSLAFGEESERYKSIVLISDGETHDENAVGAAQKLAERGVMINTVGLGSAAGAAIIDPKTNSPKKDASGNVIISRLNQQLLQQIASVTKGTYVLFQNVGSTVSQIKTQLAQIETKALADTSLLSYKSFYLWFAGPMLLLLIMELFITDRKAVRE
ncbi:MAG: VWA domain-containing protein [Chitinophagaceae bacterium]